jgi:CubicO group peptidase (beta-lactamase class C family)
MNKRFYGLMLCCLALGSLAGNVCAIELSLLKLEQIAPASNALNDLDLIVNDAMDAFNVPGVAIGVVIDGKVVLSKGYGYRNLDKGLPATENTLFAIGSCTKAFTTFILGQLVDEGKIHWDDPVIAYIPEFRLMDQYATYHITIRDLVAHRSGMARHDFLWLNPEFTRADVIKSLQYLEPACTLREKFQYNNLMYAVAGILIENVTGQTWEEELVSKIFTPLNMLNSNASVKESQTSEDFSIPYAEIAGAIRVLPVRVREKNKSSLV